MNVKATASSRDIKRRIIVIVLLVGFTGWCAYDGFVVPGYVVAEVREVDPDNAQIGHVRIAEKNDEGFDAGAPVHVVSENRQEKFTQTLENIQPLTIDGVAGDPVDRARAKDVTYRIEFEQPVAAGDKLVVHNWVVTLNQGLAIVIGAAALWQIAATLRFSRFMMEAGDGGVALGGHVIPWDRITSIDVSRFASKGLATLNYTGENGAPRTYKIDNLLLDNTDALVEEIKKRVTAEGETGYSADSGGGDDDDMPTGKPPAGDSTS